MRRAETLSCPRAVYCDTCHVRWIVLHVTSHRNQRVTLSAIYTCHKTSCIGQREPSLEQNSFEADAELIKELEKRSQPISCREGRVLFQQGTVPTGLYILQSGEANLMLESTTGKAVRCLRAGAGCLLGLPAIIGNEPYSLTAMVRRSAKVRFVTRADFEDVMQANPSLYPKLLRVLAAEVRTARRAFSEI